MPLHLPPGIYWDVWSMWSLFKIRNLIEDTSSSEYLKNHFTARTIMHIGLGSSHGLRKGSGVQGCWAASNILFRPPRILHRGHWRTYLMVTEHVQWLEMYRIILCCEKRTYSLSESATYSSGSQFSHGKNWKFIMARINEVAFKVFPSLNY